LAKPLIYPDYDPTTWQVSKTTTNFYAEMGYWFYKNFKDTGDLTNIVLASKFSIVLETFFHDNRIITYSEKIFRCLQLPRPWVLYSSQYGINRLRQLGFDVLDDQVDHSYDHVADTIQRQVAILDQCQLLVNQPLNLARCQQAADHNKSLLKSLKDNWLVNIQQDFELAYQMEFER
jgi:hypothetical protein